MPRQNRVTPSNELIAVPERGTLMGNRGVLHDAAGRIVRGWQGKRWIACVLEFKGRRRAVMSPGRYTELFFLDEATALAAGHRPCAECRRERFNEFRSAWRTARPSDGGPPGPTAPVIDAILHDDRLTPDGTKRTIAAELGELPDGVVVTLADVDGAHLVWARRLLTWSPAGYYRLRHESPGRVVTVLTPRSTVEAIRSGYVPDVHATAISLAKNRT